MLYKPINASPNMTNIDVSNSFSLKADIPKKTITGYRATVNNTENGEQAISFCYDKTSVGGSYVFPTNKISYSPTNSLLSNGNEYSWHLLYWNADYSSGNIAKIRFFNYYNNSYLGTGREKGIMLCCEGTEAEEMCSGKLFCEGYYTSSQAYRTPLLCWEGAKDFIKIDTLYRITINEDSAYYNKGDKFAVMFSGLSSIKTRKYTYEPFDYGYQLSTIKDYAGFLDNNSFTNTWTTMIQDSSTSGGFDIPITIERLKTTYDVDAIFSSPIGDKIKHIESISGNTSYSTTIQNSFCYVEFEDWDASSKKYDYANLSSNVATMLISADWQRSPDYYFFARNEPTFNIEISNGAVNTNNIIEVNDMFVSFEAKYSQPDGIDLNCVQYALYKKQDSGRIQINQSPILTNEIDVSFAYTFKGLLPSSQYSVEAWGMDDDGLVHQTFLNFNTVSSITANSSCSAAVKFIPYNAAATINYTIANTETFRELHYSLYKQADNRPYSEYSGEHYIISNGYVNNDFVNGCIDYNLENFHEYKYLIQLDGWIIDSTDTIDVSKDLLIDNLADRTSTSNSKMLLKKFGDISFTVEENKQYYRFYPTLNQFVLLETTVGETLQGSSEIIYCEKLCSLSPVKYLLATNTIYADFCGTSILGVSSDNDCYKINDMFVSAGNLSTDTDELQLNLQNNYIGGFDLFEKEQKGYSGNITGRSNILLSSNKSYDDWICFVNNNDIKILRDISGRTMVIGIDSSSIRPHHFSSEGLVNEITFSYHELGNTLNMPILETLGGLNAVY